MVDTHTHLYMEQFAGEEEAAVRRALEAGVTHMMLPCVNASSLPAMRALHALFPDVTALAVGLHPCDVTSEWRAELARLRKELDANSGEYTAIGEVGIDTYWDASLAHQQQLALREQVAWAVEKDLTLIIHCRSAKDSNDALDRVLAEVAGIPVPVIFHSFSGTVADVERILAQVTDPYFGINGIVTFKKAAIADVVPSIPLERLLLETDAPYLAPVPNRGKRNESAFLPFTAAKVAQLKDLTPQALSEATTPTALRLLFPHP